MANRRTVGIELFLLNALVDVASETSVVINDFKEKNTASWRFFEVAQRKEVLLFAYNSLAPLRAYFVWLSSQPKSLIIFVGNHMW